MSKKSWLTLYSNLLYKICPRLHGYTVHCTHCRSPGVRGEREAGAPGREQEVRRGILQHDGLPHHPQAGLPTYRFHVFFGFSGNNGF